MKTKHILTRIYFIIVVSIFLIQLILINKTISGQNDQFVYMDNDNLYMGCTAYYPKTANYLVNIVKNSIGNFHISPDFQYCFKDSNDCYNCGEDSADWHEQLLIHFLKIDSLGFNSVRIMGMPVVVDNDSIMRTNKYYDQISPTCYEETQGLILNDTSKIIMGNLIQEIVDIIRDNNIPLKLIMVLGQHGIEYRPEMFSDYVGYIANRFKSEPVIFAYDLYNEPNISTKPEGYEDIKDKIYLAEMVSGWYHSIKENAPAHHVTIGLNIYDVMNWDPSIFNLDFISYHLYQRRKEHLNWELAPVLESYRTFLEYLNGISDKPWLIGETGLPGIDGINVHPIVGSEADQAMFASETFKYSKWYGSKGYSWWGYKEVRWGSNLNAGSAWENFFGIVYFLNNLQEHKPVGDTISLLNPESECIDCENPPDSIYYNPYKYDFYEKSGYVYDSNSNPIENAMIKGSKLVYEYGQNGGDTIEHYFSILTYTDSNGFYNLYATDTTIDDYLYYWDIAYPGMETMGYWDPPDSLIYTYLETIPPDSLPTPISTADTYTITSGQNITWDSMFVMNYHKVSIDSGGTLIVTDTVYTKPETIIVVEPGGKLEIDNGAFIGLCLWHGIQVLGYPSKGQNTVDQGYVQIINGGSIENSEYGVYAFKRVEGQTDGEWEYSPGHEGGIIHASGAHFINNKIAVQFFNYPTTSISYFRNCNFVTDTNYIISEYPEYFIKISEMTAVDILNCEFRNESTSDYLHSGVYSFSSIITIDGICPNGGTDCTNWDYSLFENLEYGIYAIASKPLHHVNVRHSDFTYNYRGVYLGGMSNAEVTTNNFAVNTPFTHNGGYGLYLDECTAYTIEENNFYHSTQTKTGVGLIVNNSGGDPNEIYRNIFTKLECGISAQHQNRSTKIKDQGLCLKCNEFTNNAQDLQVVASFPPQSGDGIKTNQGANLALPDAPAGNRFSWTGPTLDDPTDIYNETADIVYYYHVAAPALKLKPEYITPETVTTTPVIGAYWLPEVSCPPSDSSGSGGSVEEMKSAMTASAQKADSVQSIITILKDGGNTQALKTEVDFSSPPESYQVYNELMDNSPYISDTVMEAAIEKENVLPNVMIRDVMVANPHNAKDETLMEKIDERSNPMPAYMKAQILQGGSLVSAFENLQSNLSFYKQQQHVAFKALSRHYLTDTINPAASHDSLAALLGNESSLNATYQLAMLNGEQGAWADGLEVLNNIPSQFELTALEAASHSQFTVYYSLLANMAQQGQGIWEADSIQLETLLDIEASAIGTAEVYARNILVALGEIEYEEPILFPDLMKSASVEQEYADLMKLLDGHHYINVFPNPTNDYIIIEHSMDKEPVNANIIIRDTKGNIVKQLEVNGKQNPKVVDTKQLMPGVYIVTLFENNKEMESVKFTKVK